MLQALEFLCVKVPLLHFTASELILVALTRGLPVQNLNKVDFYFTLCKYSLNLVSLQFRGVGEKESDISQWNLIWAIGFSSNG